MPSIRFDARADVLSSVPAERRIRCPCGVVKLTHQTSLRFDSPMKIPPRWSHLAALAIGERKALTEIVSKVVFKEDPAFTRPRLLQVADPTTGNVGIPKPPSFFQKNGPPELAGHA